MKYKITHIMKTVVEVMEESSIKRLNEGKVVTAPSWDREDIVKIFLVAKEDLGVTTTWSATSIKSAIPQFYGRLVVIRTKNHGKHCYTPAAFFEAAVNIVVVKNEEIKDLDHMLEAANERIKWLEQEKKTLVRLYNKRGEEGKKRLIMIKTMATQMENIIEGRYDTLLSK